MNARAEGARSFVSVLQIIRGFRRKAETVEAEICYELVDGCPVFQAVIVDGESLPISYASDSDLLKAYAKYRSLSL